MFLYDKSSTKYGRSRFCTYKWKAIQVSYFDLSFSFPNKHSQCWQMTVDWLSVHYHHFVLSDSCCKQIQISGSTCSFNSRIERRRERERTWRRGYLYCALGREVYLMLLRKLTVCTDAIQSIVNKEIKCSLSNKRHVWMKFNRELSFRS